MPGARISQAHGTIGAVDPASGARDATVFAMYHPAAALRGAEVERQSYEDVAKVPQVLLDVRARRAAAAPTGTSIPVPALASDPEPAADITIF
jgi:hypothetical protein